MKRKVNKKKRLETFLFAVLFLVQAIVGFFSARTVQAAVNAIEVWDENAVMDYGYRFNVKYQPGITKAVTFGCDNQDKEAFTNHGRSERNADTKRMTGPYESESAGVRYYNVGRDGQGNVVDFKLSVVSVENPEPRYDLQTVIYKRDEANGNGDSSRAYDWENNIGQPLVAFSLEEIGMFIYCVDSARVRLQFLKHNTEEPLTISGHGTIRDLDAGQGVSIPEGSCLDSAYVVKGNDFLIVDGTTVTAQNVSLETSDKRGWLNLLYNTDSVYFDFTHKKQLERWDTYRNDGIAERGSVEAWAEYMRKKYVDADGNSYCPNFDGGKIMRGHAYFDFTSYCFGGIEMKKAPEKRVGAADCTWEEAVNTNQENPFMINGNEEFQYMVQAEVTPNQFNYFEVQDTLENCFTIEGSSKVLVINDIGQDVTEQFDIRVEGQNIICSAKAEYLSQEAFTNNQIYTFSFKVYRKADIAEYIAPDGYSILVPNSAVMNFQRINGPEESMPTETVWVRGVTPPELAVEKIASQYEWAVGDTIDYAVTVTQKKENTKAVHVVMEDTLPSGLQLLEGEYQVETTSGVENAVISGNGQNGWVVQCPELNYGEAITVRFRCIALEESNGLECANVVSATAENLINLNTGEQESVKDMAEIWTNSPQLEINKTADKYEWQIGDEVSYRIVVNNNMPGTIARDVRIADIGLPEGLVLSAGAQSVEILDVLQQVDYPVPDKMTGQAYEVRPVESYLEADANGFAFYCSYLPYSHPVTILFHCTALETANGRESVNAATVSAGNAVEKSDDGEVFVNTGEFYIEKSADHYEWELGEQVEYTVLVENRMPGTIARNVTVWDNTMPAGLALASPDSVSITGIPQSIIEPVAGTEDIPGMLNPEYYQETAEKQVSYEFVPEGTGWRLSISDLPAGVPIAVTFFCTVTEEVNGMESINAAGVQAENAPEQNDNAEVYVNTAVLSIDKSFENPYLGMGDGREAHEFRVGEQVNYQVTVENLQKGSIARELVISDISLPEGLVLDNGDDALIVYGIPQTISNPVAGTDSAGRMITPKSYNNIEEKPVEYQVLREDTGWIVMISDLPYHTPVTVDFRCIVQESINGMEVVNTANAYARNADTVKATAKVWINSPMLKVSKESDKPSYKYGDVITYRVKLTQEQPGCVARNVILNDVMESSGVQILKDSIVLLDENGNMLDAVVDVNADNAFGVSTGRNLIKDARYSIYDSEQGGTLEQVLLNPLDLQEQKEMTVEYRVAVVEENPAGQTVHNVATGNSQENHPSTGESTVEVQEPTPTVTPTPVPTATPMPTATPIPTATPRPTAMPIPTVTPSPTATPRPTATPIPRPTTGNCPRLTPAPTRIPTINNNNNSGPTSNGYYTGNYQSGYQTNGAKTGDTRPFKVMAGVGVLGIILLEGGCWLYRKAKKTGNKR